MILNLILLYTLFHHTHADSVKFMEQYKSSIEFFPESLEEIGRATYLVHYHVNDHLPKEWEISFDCANEILFEGLVYVKHYNKVAVLPVIPLTVIKLLEDASWEKAERILLENGKNLDSYLESKPTKKAPDPT